MGHTLGCHAPTAGLAASGLLEECTERPSAEIRQRGRIGDSCLHVRARATARPYGTTVVRLGARDPLSPTLHASSRASVRPTLNEERESAVPAESPYLGTDQRGLADDTTVICRA